MAEMWYLCFDYDITDGMETLQYDGICLDEGEKVWAYIGYNGGVVSLNGMLITKEDQSIQRGFGHVMSITEFTDDEYEVPTGYCFFGKLSVHAQGVTAYDIAVRIGTTDPGEWSAGGGA